MSIKSTLREYLPYAFVTLNMAVSEPLLVAFFPLDASFSSLEGRLYGFPTGEARLYGFIQTGAFNYLKGAHHNPQGLKGRVKLKPL